MGDGRSLRRQIQSVIPLLAWLQAGRVPGAWDCAEDRDGSHEPDARTPGEEALPEARGDME